MNRSLDFKGHVLVLGLALLLASCGGDKDTPAQDTPKTGGSPQQQDDTGSTDALPTTVEDIKFTNRVYAGLKLVSKKRARYFVRPPGYSRSCSFHEKITTKIVNYVDGDRVFITTLEAGGDLSTFNMTDFFAEICKRLRPKVVGKEEISIKTENDLVRKLIQSKIDFCSNCKVSFANKGKNIELTTVARPDGAEIHLENKYLINLETPFLAAFLEHYYRPFFTDNRLSFDPSQQLFYSMEDSPESIDRNFDANNYELKLYSSQTEDVTEEFYNSIKEKTWRSDRASLTMNDITGSIRLKVSTNYKTRKGNYCRVKYVFNKVRFYKNSDEARRLRLPQHTILMKSGFYTRSTVSPRPSRVSSRQRRYRDCVDNIPEFTEENLTKTTHSLYLRKDEEAELIFNFTNSDATEYLTER